MTCLAELKQEDYFMKTINVELNDEEQKLFIEFRRRLEVIAPIIGYMDTLGLMDMRNTQITLDLDNNGTVAHMSLTRHYRK